MMDAGCTGTSLARPPNDADIDALTQGLALGG
jgi:hypothetical protein